jgi:hypothetical protein
MNRILKVIKDEGISLFPVWLFFFLAFSLLRLTENIRLREQGIHLSTPSLVLVGSLIVAKAFLILNVFRFMNRYEGRPLIYSVLWKTVIYWVGSLVVFYLEQVLEVVLKTHDLAKARELVFTKMDVPQFWISATWLALLLFAFCGTQELARTIGMQRFKQMWFGTSARPNISDRSDDKKAA